MITYQKAIEIAKSLIAEFPPCEVLDFDEHFAVAFDMGDTPPPGVPSVVLVHKSTEETDYLTIPPIENIERLEKAPTIWAAD